MKKLKHCINSKVFHIWHNQNKFFTSIDDTTEIPPLNFMDTIQKFEEFLINKNILKSKDSKGYQQLLDMLGEKYDYKIFSEIKKSNIFLYYANNYLSIYTIMYNSCPRKVLSTSKYKKLMKIKRVYNDIIANGGPTPSIIKKLTLIPDFEKNKVLRLSTCNLIFLYLQDETKKRNRKAPKLIEKNGLLYKKDSISRK